ncbi:uncharacterized protein [Halyomorpha halys]|uniref:uncharacterized protein isoform X3 n=1 Tax=Halyomorpha halys TaxID=286706 RepID=UPI0006D4FC0B|nr:uncharacterized protein LOC106681148 isoform X1 [Halyomorpha halys]
MDEKSNMDAAEPTLTCPYNKAHSIISSRMQFHLTKCRIQHPTNEKAVCPFNSTHVIPQCEYAYHLSFCPDRIVLDAFTCKVGSSNAPKVDHTTVEPIIVKSDENWEVSDEPAFSVLERVHEVSRTKPTLTALIGAPKSERKAFRNQERLRIQRVLDSQESKVGEGTGIRTETGEGSAKKNVQVSKGRNETNGGEREVVTTQHNFNYRAMNANQGQTQNFQNSNKNQGSPRDETRDPRNPWGTKRQNDIVRTTDFTQLNTRKNEGPGSYTGAGNFKDARNEGNNIVENSSFRTSPVRERNPWGTQRQDDIVKSTDFPQLNTKNNEGAGAFKNARGEAYAAVRNSTFRTSPVRERDPGNPWKVTKESPPPTVSPTTDPENFPVLIPACRGRGKNKYRK